MRYYSEFRAIASKLGSNDADTMYRHYRAWHKASLPVNADMVEKSIRKYMQDYIPDVSMRAVSELLGESSDRMLRWLREMEVPVTDTIKGYLYICTGFFCDERHPDEQQTGASRVRGRM